MDKQYTAKEILEFMDHMDNGERIELLKALYFKHYDKGISREQIEEERRILRLYYDGDLVEVDNDDY